MLALVLVTALLQTSHAADTTKDQAFSTLVDADALDVDHSPAREAAATKILAARGETVLPNLAWDLLDPEAQRAIAFDQQVERMVDAEVAATAFKLQRPRQNLSNLQTREIDRLIELMGPGVSAGNRATLRSILGQLAVTTPGLPPDAGEGAVSALDLKAEAVGRLARRALKAHHAGAYESVAVNVITALRMMMKAHLIIAASPGRRDDLQKARAEVGYLIGFVAPIAGYATVTTLNDLAGVLLFFGSFPLSVASARWGGHAVGLVAPRLFASRVQRRRADHLIEDFWHRVEPYLRHQPAWERLIRGGQPGSGPLVAQSFVDLMISIWPGTAESLCNRVLSEVARVRK